MRDLVPVSPVHIICGILLASYWPVIKSQGAQLTCSVSQYVGIEAPPNWTKIELAPPLTVFQLISLRSKINNELALTLFYVLGALARPLPESLRFLLTQSYEMNTTLSFFFNRWENTVKGNRRLR